MSNDPQFDLFMSFVLKHEGGYTNDPNDTGGETKYGISKRAYPMVDIASLTPEGAGFIYRRDWWERYGFSRLYSPIGAKVCDMAVNMGTRPEVLLLQQACSALGRQLAIDGILGQGTVDTANSIDSDALMRALCAVAESHYKAIVETHPSDAKFLKGWLARADDIPTAPEQSNV